LDYLTNPQGQNLQQCFADATNSELKIHIKQNDNTLCEINQEGKLMSGHLNALSLSLI
jgi:hypothetical protein